MVQTTGELKLLTGSVSSRNLYQCKLVDDFSFIQCTFHQFKFKEQIC